MSSWVYNVVWLQGVLDKIRLKIQKLEKAIQAQREDCKEPCTTKCPIPVVSGKSRCVDAVLCCCVFFYFIIFHFLCDQVGSVRTSTAEEEKTPRCTWSIPIPKALRTRSSVIRLHRMEVRWDSPVKPVEFQWFFFLSLISGIFRGSKEIFFYFAQAGSSSRTDWMVVWTLADVGMNIVVVLETLPLMLERVTVKLPVGHQKIE